MIQTVFRCYLKYLKIDNLNFKDLEPRAGDQMLRVTFSQNILKKTPDIIKNAEFSLDIRSLKSNNIVSGW